VTHASVSGETHQGLVGEGKNQAGRATHGTFRRAVITAPRQIVMEEVPIPEVGPGQVLVRVQASALCTWEQRVWAGIDTWSYPLVGGHETAGVVEALGPDVEPGIKVGDVVAVTRLKRCGQCYACRRGLDNLCDNASSRRVPGQPWGPGGFGEYVVAEGYQVYRLRPDVPCLEAALTEPLACVLHDLKLHPIRPGDTAVIIGAGIMGLLHLLLARRSAAFVIVSEPDPTRRQKALELGADAVIDAANEDYVQRVLELTDGRGANVTYVAVGVPSAIEAAVAAAAKRGRVSVYASIHPRDQTVTIPANTFHYREVTLGGSMSQDHEDFLLAAELISRREIDLQPLITKTYPLSRLSDAFEVASRREHYRVLVVPDR
jgi:L-iditol 2-dehydrogenase